MLRGVEFLWKIAILPLRRICKLLLGLQRKDSTRFARQTPDVVYSSASLAYGYFQCLHICREAFFNMPTHIWSYPVFDNYMNISLLNYYICTQKAVVLEVE